MTSGRSLDFESLQTFLANVFLVHESGIDARSLVAFVKIQRAIANGTCDAEEVMRLVTDHAREVANATGVAIALLEADQLVCRAGSGSAVSEIGRHVTAVLSATAHNERKEILRVENADTDSRIEAEICRQFGGTSLLMLPIYREEAVAGVLEVIFSAEHAFQEREVRTYRLLAGLVEEAMARTASAPELVPELIPELMPELLEVPHEMIPHAVEEMASEMQVCDDEESAPAVSTEPWVRQACAAAGGGSPMAGASVKAAPAAAAPERSIFLSEVWRKGTAAAAVAALLITGWTAFVHHRASFEPGTVTESTNPAVPGVLSNPSSFKPLAAVSSDSPGASRTATERGLPGFTRRRVSANEVDYFADDVTMKVFTLRHPTSAAKHWSREVVYGDDVTVRYFASPARVSASTDPPDRGSAVSK
jgi:hypothetical protein